LKIPKGQLLYSNNILNDEIRYIFIYNIPENENEKFYKKLCNFKDIVNNIFSKKLVIIEETYNYNEYDDYEYDIRQEVYDYTIVLENY